MNFNCEGNSGSSYIRGVMQENEYNPKTDAVLLELMHNTFSDINVELALELGFTLKSENGDENNGRA